MTCDVLTNEAYTTIFLSSYSKKRAVQKRRYPGEIYDAEAKIIREVEKGNRVGVKHPDVKRTWTNISATDAYERLFTGYCVFDEERALYFVSIDLVIGDKPDFDSYFEWLGGRQSREEDRIVKQLILQALGQ